MYNLSVVNIAPLDTVEDVNSFAEGFGCGRKNLSVKLLDQDGELFYGCHSWWKEEDYNYFKSLEDLEDFQLYERVSSTGTAQENWNAALEELGLEVIIERDEEDDLDV